MVMVVVMDVVVVVWWFWCLRKKKWPAAMNVYKQSTALCTYIKVHKVII